MTIIAAGVVCACSERVGPEPPQVGALQIMAITIGRDMDTDGYAAAVDGYPPLLLGLNDTLVLDSVSPGDYSVALSGIAANCYVTNANPQQVPVTSGFTISTKFRLSCLRIPDDVELAFVAFAGGSTEIHGVRVDGSGLVNLTLHPAAESEPAWSPDGTRLAFSRNSAIWVMNADGTGLTQLTSATGPEREPAWSPDGTRIAFRRGTLRRQPTVTGDQVADIYVINADGTGLLNVTDTPGVEEAAPSWAPDGLRIIFERSALAANNSEVFTVAPDGSGLAQLTVTTALDREPRFSPDGSMIVFRSSRPGVDYDLYLMNADGSAVRPVLTRAGAQLQPAWSPDGTQIAFAEAGQIVVMHADGTGVTSIVGGTVSYPAWRVKP